MIVLTVESVDHMDSPQSEVTSGTIQARTRHSPPRGFVVLDCTTVTNRILEILWDSNPLTDKELAARLIGVDPQYVWTCLIEMSYRGDVTRSSKQWTLPYCVHPHPVVEDQNHSGLNTRILTLLERASDPLSPATISRMLNASRRSVYNRLSELVETGQIARPRQGGYCIHDNPKTHSEKKGQDTEDHLQKSLSSGVQIWESTEDKKQISESVDVTQSHSIAQEILTPHLSTKEKPELELIKSTLDVLIQEDLERCGGTCHAVVKRLTKKVVKRTGLKSNKKLKRVIIQLLEEDSRATLWDLGHAVGEVGKTNLSQRIYALKTDGLSSTTFSKQTPREPSVRERVLDLFTDEVVLTPKTAAELLQIKRDSVNHILLSLASNNELVRVEKGFYCLPGQKESAREKIDAMRNPISMEQIEHVLSEEFPLTPGDISRRLQTSYSLVTNALNRFVSYGQIVRVKRGFYCLPDQVGQYRHRLEETNPIVKALRENYPQTPLQISKLLGKPRSTVGGLLQRLAKKGVTVKIRHGLYCLPDQVQDAKLRLKDVLEARIIRRKSQRPTLADTVFRVITLLLTSKGMSVTELSSATGVSLHMLTNTLQRLIDEFVLIKSETGLVSIAPQDNPEQIKVIQMIAESGSWTDVIRSLISKYMEKLRTDTSRSIQRLFRIRRFVCSQLHFLHSTESQVPFSKAVDALCLEGVLEKLDTDLYRFNQLP